MPETSRTSTINLQEVNARVESAQHVITGFSRAIPNLADLWQQVTHSLSDIPILIAEITRLGTELTLSCQNRANLAAAARAALAAHRDGQSDPWWFLRDELAAQGFTIERRPA